MADNKREALKTKCTRLAVAAIDFGTTYSGYAFSWRHEWKKVQVNQWNCGDFLSSKAPTTILLKPDKSFYAFGFEAETLFTSMAEQESDSEDDEEEGPKENCKDCYYFHRFKMLLHKDERLHRNTEIKDITGKKMNAMDIFSMSIKYLKNSMMDIMNSTKTFEMLEKDIDYVLTVPAIWGDAAKMFMREAAVKAGIPSDQLTIALEPEAASIYCQYMYLEQEYDKDPDSTFQKQVTEKSKYMVVDLGGGTADITVHKQADDGTLEEMLPATGGPLGGTSVDNEYADFLETIGGKGVLNKFKEHCLEDHLDIFRNFESAKRAYNGKKVRIKIPVKFENLIKKDKTKGSISKALRDSQYKDHVTYAINKLALEPSVFEELFKKAVDGISNFIEDILANKSFDDVRTIIMVGGFSECSLIQNAIKTKFSSYRIITPTEAGLAVIKGAVYFGHLPNAISRRVSRYTYGIQSWPEFTPGIDPPSKEIDVNGSLRCKDVFFPVVRRGEQIPVGFKKSQVFQSLKPDQSEMECAIYVSDQENPRFIDDGSCRQLGILKVPLPLGFSSAEIEETIIFGETEIKFVAHQIGSGKVLETSFDMLDFKNLPGS
ncbi:heat shock 70 kDa protein 12A-like [Ostrea edulis]|uniref:heat shock 70 kDa protein 12A-like n=1 Tax=Ostrea edulis TaxID=37623 RepID=UPI0024AFE46B|nr:heat shock 70 kDa protein 12A-like [Ostrea edulis]